VKIENCKVGMRVVGKNNGKHYEITEVFDDEVEVVLLSPIGAFKYTSDPKYLRKVLKEVKP
jgi:hypothetical protein